MKVLWSLSLSSGRWWASILTAVASALSVSDWIKIQTCFLIEKLKMSTDSWPAEETQISLGISSVCQPNAPLSAVLIGGSQQQVTESSWCFSTRWLSAHPKLPCVFTELPDTIGRTLSVTPTNSWCPVQVVLCLKSFDFQEFGTQSWGALWGHSPRQRSEHTQATPKLEGSLIKAEDRATPPAEERASLCSCLSLLFLMKQFCAQLFITIILMRRETLSCRRNKRTQIF